MATTPRRLDWKRTYPGIEKDYSTEIRDASNERIAIARVLYAEHVPGEDKWRWTASREALIGGGYVFTAEEGVRLAEEALLGAETQKAAHPEG